MKTLTTLFFILSIQFQLIAQYQANNFETNVNLDVKIGETAMDSLWQIGVPQKNLFESAFSPPRAILTDTLNSYPANQSASFTIELEEAVAGFPFIQIEWYQKMDVEQGVDGGIIEASYDGGNTWLNVFDSPVYRPAVVGIYELDTLHNGQQGLTGVSDWSWVALCWGTYYGTQPSEVSTIQIRFTFVSDAIDTNQEGWMIDNFSTAQAIIGATAKFNFSELSIFPNPSKSEVYLNLEEIVYEELQLEIVDAVGQMVHKEIIESRGAENHRISINHFPNGVYFISLFNGNTIYQQRMIKDE